MDFEFLKDMSYQELVKFKADVQKGIKDAFDALPPEIIDTPIGPFCTDSSLIVCPSCRELFGDKRPGASHSYNCVYMRLKRLEAKRDPVR